MSRDTGIDAERDAIHARAAEWFARLQEPAMSLEDTLEWQQWLGADERHARAFQRIETVWREFGALEHPALSANEALAGDGYDGSMTVSDYRQRVGAARHNANQPFPRPLRRAGLAIAAFFAVAAIGLAAYVYVTHEPGPYGGSNGLIETAIGENRSVELPDGSRVTLGGYTRLKVALDARSRQLRLLRGEAFFRVARDPARPFTVQAGSAAVTAVGTEFNVRRSEDRVVVAVVEGRVLVEPSVPALQQLPLLRNLTSRSPRRVPRQLQAGNQTVVNGAGIESSIDLADPAAAAAWQNGRLAFEREPLRYVLEDVNRYARKPIVLAEESIGDLRITGTVINDNVAGWIASLESAFALHATEEPARIVLTRAR